MGEGMVVVYGTNWCGDCRRTRRYLDYLKIPYQWIDIDQDKEGEQFVLKTNQGMRRVPTIVFADGSILVEPSNLKVSQQLGIST